MEPWLKPRLKRMLRDIWCWFMHIRHHVYKQEPKPHSDRFELTCKKCNRVWLYMEGSWW